MTPLLASIRLRSGDADAARRVTWLELFFDLVFVAAVAQAAAPLAADYSLAGLGRFAFLFGLIWWAWLGQTMFATRFDPDDVVQRLLTVAQIFGVAVMAINADGPLDGRTTAGFVAAYAGLRLILVVEYLRARRVPGATSLTRRTAGGAGLAAVLWLVSAVSPPILRVWLWLAAAAIEVATVLATSRYAPEVPPHAAHLPERFGLFTIILLGESLVAVMKGMKTQETWTLAAAASALLGVTVVFTLWWWYFEGAHAAADWHVRSRRDASRFHAWTYAHFPLYLGIAVTGVGAEHVIEYAPVGHLHTAEAWMLSGALAAAMLAVTVLAASHVPPTAAAQARRLASRHVGLTLATISVGAVGPLLAPAAFLLGLVVLAASQVVVSVAGGPPPDLHTPHPAAAHGSALGERATV